MRKTFLIAISVTALLALAIGGAYTWTAQTQLVSPQGQNGTISGQLVNVASTGNQLYPLGLGNPIPIFEGDILNTTPTNPGIALHAVAGAGNVAPQSPSCGIIGTALTFANNNAIAPNATGNHWTWSAAMPADAPQNCMGGTFTANIYALLST
jgi:hypothetical protein